MADSDNSRTLSPVTRRDFHSLLAASLPTCQSLSAPPKGLFDTRKDDPAMDAWRVWWARWGLLTESSRRQQQLERRLFSIDGSLRKDASDGDREYQDALRVEGRASKNEEEAAAALWQTPAQSVTGAIAKLHAAVTRWQPSPTSQQGPWPQIRAVIADLLRIDAASLAGGDSPTSMRELQSAIQGS